MDPSVTYKELRCLWCLMKYFWRELSCPSFTNIKAFVIAYLCSNATAYSVLHAKSGLLYYVAPPLFILSTTSLLVETVGVFTRIISYHEFFYSITCYDKSL